MLRTLTSQLSRLWLTLALCGLLAMGAFAVFVYIPTFVEVVGSPSPHLHPAQALLLGGYLAGRTTELAATIGRDPTPVAFTVAAGDSATVVAANLAELGLIPEARLLRDYMRYKGLDVLIETGYFEINATQTIPTIAQALTNAIPSEIRVRIWEGWRIEQVAAALSARTHLDVDGVELLRHIQLEKTLPGNYSFVELLPSGATLEGFLPPDTYSFQPRATTTEVLDNILTAAATQLTHLREEAANHDLSWYEVLILASIVEREIIHDDEGPLIAGVFLKRLMLGMPLGADPTTQYALGHPGDWWPRITFDPRQVSHPYNTYINKGLPPGPICSPGQAAIRSVLYPENTDYLYFRAACDGSRRHNFAYTYEQHLSNACDP